MTKRRSPLTIDAALTAIAAQLPSSWDEMAEITGRRRGTVRSWADPDRREQIPLRDAALLDEAFCRAGGSGAPLLAWYTARLDSCGVLSQAEPIARMRQIAAAIRECGEAHAAMVLAAHPGASDRTLAMAQREVKEAINELYRTLPLFGEPTPVPAPLEQQLGPSATHQATGPPGG